MHNNDFDFLGFDPSQINAISAENNYNYNSDFIRRSLNYPIDNYYKEYKNKIYDAKTVVTYCYNELVKQSFEAIRWLQNSQFAKKSEKEDKAHENKMNQILSFEFQILFYSKFNNIVELSKRISDKLDVYCWEYNYYKFIMDKFINYIVGTNKDKVLYEQVKTLVDGIMKITLSARWEYETKSFILENKPYSNKYILNNGKWTKING